MVSSGCYRNDHDWGTRPSSALSDGKWHSGCSGFFAPEKAGVCQSSVKNHLCSYHHVPCLWNLRSSCCCSKTLYCVPCLAVCGGLPRTYSNKQQCQGHPVVTLSTLPQIVEGWGHLRPPQPGAHRWFVLRQVLRRFDSPSQHGGPPPRRCPHSWCHSSSFGCRIWKCRIGLLQRNVIPKVGWLIQSCRIQVSLERPLWSVSCLPGPAPSFVAECTPSFLPVLRPALTCLHIELHGEQRMKSTFRPISELYCRWHAQSVRTCVQFWIAPKCHPKCWLPTWCHQGSVLSVSSDPSVPASETRHLRPANRHVVLTGPGVRVAKHWPRTPIASYTHWYRPQAWNLESGAKVSERCHSQSLDHPPPVWLLPLVPVDCSAWMRYLFLTSAQKESVVATICQKVVENTVLTTKLSSTVQK